MAINRNCDQSGRWRLISHAFHRRLPMSSYFFWSAFFVHLLEKQTAEPGRGGGGWSMCNNIHWILRTNIVLRRGAHCAYYASSRDWLGVAAALKEKQTGEAWGEGAAAGLAAIQQYGGAKPGDRTMLDALAPAINSYQSKLSLGTQRTSLHKLLRCKCRLCMRQQRSLYTKKGYQSKISCHFQQAPVQREYAC